jgi:Integrase core domain
VRSLVHHSDQGVQYVSREYRKFLQKCGIFASVSRPGTPLDNASCESFMRTLKREEIRAGELQSLEELRRNISVFIDRYYNQQRLHSALGYRPPQEFEDVSNSGGSKFPSAGAILNLFAVYAEIAQDIRLTTNSYLKLIEGLRPEPEFMVGVPTKLSQRRGSPHGRVPKCAHAAIRYLRGIVIERACQLHPLVQSCQTTIQESPIRLSRRYGFEFNFLGVLQSGHSTCSSS